MNDLSTLMQQLGDEACAIALRYFRKGVNVHLKNDATPVTVADREIENRLRALIAAKFPTHHIVGEEYGGEVARGYSWVIDPIDGTKSFATGIPLYGVLVGLLLDSRPVSGIIDFPSLDERWTGDGQLTTLNGESCRSSGCKRVSEARLCMTDPGMFAGAKNHVLEALTAAVQIIRFGTDAYGYALLASGHADLVIETGLKLHDVTALVPILEGAGATVTTWTGAPITATFRGNIVASATRELHADVLRLLSDKH